MKTILYCMSILLMMSFTSCKKNKQKNSDNVASSASESSNKIEWMHLSNQWVPVITEFDKIIHAVKKAYSKKDYKESLQKIKEANEILLKKDEKDHTGNNELKNSSESLRKLSERIEDSTASELDFDTVLYRVCDESGKHCWIMQDREDDYWAPEEEINEHIDSAYIRLSVNDSTGVIHLYKADALIKVKTQRASHPKVKMYFTKANDELRTILKMIKKEEKLWHQVYPRQSQDHFSPWQFHITLTQA